MKHFTNKYILETWMLDLCPELDKVSGNRCPRKLKKAIKNTFEFNSNFNLIKPIITSKNVKRVLKEIVFEFNTKNWGKYSIHKGRINF